MSDVGICQSSICEDCGHIPEMCSCFKRLWWWEDDSGEITEVYT
jgi:hypothetical protein